MKYAVENNLWGERHSGEQWGCFDMGGFFVVGIFYNNIKMSVKLYNVMFLLNISK